MIDEKTIEKCLEGNKRAQRALFKAYSQRMFVLCYRYVKNKEDAEEMVSDGFVKIFHSLSSFDYKNLKSLEAWIKRIMINECLMFLRKRKITFLDENVAVNVESKNKADDELAANELYDLLLSLPVGYRTIFNLYAIEGYSHKEISKLLGINEGTSRSQLTKARSSLKEMVNKRNV